MVFSGLRSKIIHRKIYADVCYVPGQKGILFACVFAFIADFYAGRRFLFSTKRCNFSLNIGYNELQTRHHVFVHAY